MFSNPYGETVYASYYKFWKAKLIVYQDMVVYANRYSQPIPTVTYDDDTLAAQAQNISDNLYAGANIALPEGVKAEFLTALGSASSNPFIPILEWLDGQISLAICGIDLSQGSYAADKVIQEERALYVKDLQRDIEDQLFEQIIKRFISQNFDKDSFPLSIYPKIKFTIAVKEPSLSEFMDSCTKAKDMGAIDPEYRLADKNKIRNVLGFDEVDTDEQEEIEIEEEAEAEEIEESKTSIEDEIKIVEENNFSFHSFINKGAVA
jgi:phage gp29-like protein